MRRVPPLLALLVTFVVVSGMDCQGTTTPPNGDPNGNPPGGALKINGVTPSAVDDKLFISGEFGDTQGVVMLGGVTLNIVTWGPASPKPQQIVCDLPRELSGNLQVQVGTEFSNVAQLTKWELVLTSTTNINATPPSTGFHRIDITTKLIIRACLNNLLAGSSPVISAQGAVSRASTADIDASGTITNPVTPPDTKNRITASKLTPQEFKIVYPGDVIDPDVDKFIIDSFVCNGRRGADAGFKLLFTLSGFYKLTQELDAGTFNSEKSTGYATNTYLDTSLPVTFSMDSGYNILAGNVAAKSDPNSTLTWQTIPPQSPPVD